MIKDVDLDPLPDGFKTAITVAKGQLELTQDVGSVEALVVKHHAAVRTFKKMLIEQTAVQYKLEARLKAMETAVPAAARQSATEAMDLARQAGSTAGVVNLRVDALTEQLNAFAGILEMAEKKQQGTLDQHLKAIEETFRKCDGILTDVKASVMTS